MSCRHFDVSVSQRPRGSVNSRRLIDHGSEFLPERMNGPQAFYPVAPQPVTQGGEMFIRPGLAVASSRLWCVNRFNHEYPSSLTIEFTDDTYQLPIDVDTAINLFDLWGKELRGLNANETLGQIHLCP